MTNTKNSDPTVLDHFRNNAAAYAGALVLTSLFVANHEGGKNYGYHPADNHVPAYAQTHPSDPASYINSESGNK